LLNLELDSEIFGFEFRLVLFDLGESLFSRARPVRFFRRSVRIIVRVVSLLAVFDE
jgi:hypothetical protein